MPRERVIRGRRVVECLKHSPKPYVTTVDIADYLDVTPQAVRNRDEELKNYDGLEWGRVGSALVFWDSEEETGTETEGRAPFEWTLISMRDDHHQADVYVELPEDPSDQSHFADLVIDSDRGLRIEVPLVPALRGEVERLIMELEAALDFFEDSGGGLDE